MINLSEKFFKKPNYYYQKRAKETLQKDVRKQLESQEVLEGPFPMGVELNIYRDSNRRMDLDNTAVLLKFALDEIKLSHIPDDDFRYIGEINIVDKGVDKENPRAELIFFKKN